MIMHFYLMIVKILCTLLHHQNGSMETHVKNNRLIMPSSLVIGKELVHLAVMHSNQINRLYWLLVFASISVWQNERCADSKSDLHLDVTFIETENRNSNDDRLTQTLLNFKVNLPMKKETLFMLPALVCVRSGFYCEIQRK